MLKERMRDGRKHRGPLQCRRKRSYRRLAPTEHGSEEYIFPGDKRERALSVMSMDMVMLRMKSTVTMYGFRSNFRDWCFEVSDFPREMAEAALAHVVGDHAYRRGDALAKRGDLMKAWGELR